MLTKEEGWRNEISLRYWFIFNEWNFDNSIWIIFKHSRKCKKCLSKSTVILSFLKRGRYRTVNAFPYSFLSVKRYNFSTFVIFLRPEKLLVMKRSGTLDGLISSYCRRWTAWNICEITFTIWWRSRLKNERIVVRKYWKTLEIGEYYYYEKHEYFYMKSAIFFKKISYGLSYRSLTVSAQSP